MAERPIRVLFSGYYGLGNLGDEAILAGMLGALRGAEADVRVLSGDPSATHALHGVTAYHRVRGLLPALAWSEVVVSGGGGLLQDGTSRRSLAYYLGVLGVARRLGRKTLVFGQSLGPLQAAGRRRVARALRDVPLAVRDAPSERLARELGLDPVRVADGALLLEPPPPGDRTGPVVLVPRHGYPALNGALAAAGQRLRASGTPLAVLGLHASEDAAAAAALLDALPGSAAWSPADPRDALARLADARYVLSARLHGLILACVANVGFSGLIYDPKVAGFLEAAGAPAHAAPVAPERLAAEARRARPIDADIRAALRRQAAEGAAWLRHHIAG